jgi:hypothetical protein
MTYTEALKHFEIAEANLVKLEKLWEQIYAHIPNSPAFDVGNFEYDNLVSSYTEILPHLSLIDGWRPEAIPAPLNSIGQWHLDALEIGEIAAKVAVDEEIIRPNAELKRYRFLLKKKRLQLLRQTLLKLIESGDAEIALLKKNLPTIQSKTDSKAALVMLKDIVEQVEVLLGSNPRPEKWNDLWRHLRFGEPHDIEDITNTDWPSIKASLSPSLYNELEPIPSEIPSLDSLVEEKLTGNIPRKLKWENIDAEQFERLIFTLFNSAPGYENCKWLTQTNAADRGRDISVDRVTTDSLTGTLRARVIIQCKHWLSKSISINELSALTSQMKLWEPPRVDTHIIATSGRFTTDAVAYIEKHNQEDKALRIEMWPESHLEGLLTARPELIAEFRLR